MANRHVPFHWFIMRSNYNYGTGVFGPEYLWVEHTGSQVETSENFRGNLHRTKPGRWRPPTPYSRLVWAGNIWAPEVLAEYEMWNGSGKDRKVFTGAVDGSSIVSYLPTAPASLQARCEVKCLQKLKAQRVNYSQALGERKQTVAMVSQTIGRLTRMVRAIKRGDIRGLKQAIGKRWKRTRGVRKLEPTLDCWLEYQYGWKPLLSDVYGAIEDLNQREKDRGRIKASVKASARDVELLVERGRVAGFTNDYLDATVRRNIEHRVFVRLDYQKTDSPWSTLAQMGISNPLSLAWELLPWSFVADWFIPIGDYLDILDADLGWSFAGGSCSTKTTEKLVWTDPEIVSTGWPLASGYATINGRGKRMSFQRTTYSSTPWPDLSFLTTKLMSSSLTHMANGLALLRKAIGK